MSRTPTAQLRFTPTSLPTAASATTPAALATSSVTIGASQSSASSSMSHTPPAAAYNLLATAPWTTLRDTSRTSAALSIAEPHSRVHNTTRSHGSSAFSYSALRDPHLEHAFMTGTPPVCTTSQTWVKSFNFTIETDNLERDLQLFFQNLRLAPCSACAHSLRAH
jgi:hypothetical protein